MLVLIILCFILFIDETKFIIYDFETSGLDKWHDIPLDGAFILTDENFNKLDEYSFKIALPTGLMPSPIGLLVNKTNLKTIFDGPYFDAMADLHKKLSSWVLLVILE